uniref:Venom protein n=1 Tax=Hadrurus spadix TaxID=141984 RepID=A0A1W7R952_9SCOR
MYLAYLNYRQQKFKTMKYVILLIAVITVTQCKERCKNSNECRVDECCVQFSEYSTRCERRPKAGRICYKTEYMNEENSVYRGKCPCLEDMECKLWKGQNESPRKGRCEKIETTTPTRTTTHTNTTNNNNREDTSY